MTGAAIPVPQRRVLQACLLAAVLAFSTGAIATDPTPTDPEGGWTTLNYPGLEWIRFHGYRCEPNANAQSVSGADIMGISNWHSIQNKVQPFVENGSIRAIDMYYMYDFSTRQMSNDIQGPPPPPPGPPGTPPPPTAPPPNDVPENAEGFTNGNDPHVSVGQAGHFVAHMVEPIQDLPGPDVTVYELVGVSPYSLSYQDVRTNDSPNQTAEPFCMYGANDLSGPYYFVGASTPDSDPDHRGRARSFDLSDHYSKMTDEALEYVLIMDSELTQSDLIADFSWTPDTPLGREDVTLTDTSISIGGPVDQWVWTLDGAVVLEGTTSSPSLVVEFPQGGNPPSEPRVYEVCLSVSSTDTGLDEEVCKPISVLNRPPVPGFTIEKSIANRWQHIRFTDQSEDLDGQVMSWYWDFEGEAPTSFPPAKYDVAYLRGFDDIPESIDYIYDSEGIKTAVLTIEDDQGAWSIFTMDISLQKPDNIPPQIVQVENVEVSTLAEEIWFEFTAGDTVVLHVRADDEDGPNSALEYSLQTIPERWDVDTSGEGMTLTFASNGTTYDEDGNEIPGDEGIHVLRVVVSDGEATDELTLKIKLRSSVAPFTPYDDNHNGVGDHADPCLGASAHPGCVGEPEEPKDSTIRNGTAPPPEEEGKPEQGTILPSKKPPAPEPAANETESTSPTCFVDCAPVEACEDCDETGLPVQSCEACKEDETGTVTKSVQTKTNEDARASSGLPLVLGLAGAGLHVAALVAGIVVVLRARRG